MPPFSQPFVTTSPVYDDGDAHCSDDSSGDCTDREKREEQVVCACADAVVEPHAVVIKTVDAFVARTAVFCLVPNLREDHVCT